MKKAVAISMILSLMLAITACGGNSPAPQPAPEPPAQEAVLPTPSPAPAPDSAPAAPANLLIRMSTTTSVNDSGLLPAIIPDFEAQTGYAVDVVSNGSGAAIKLGESGDADILLVHSKAAEEKFIEGGYGIERKPFMYNFFVIIGPNGDPAGVKECENATEAFKKIAESKSLFVSRGDDSGTHNAEKKIWTAAGLEPGESDEWYISAGAGMGACLNQSNEREAYVLSDKATFLSMKDNLDLEILLEKGDEMKNTYSLIICSPDKNSGLNTEGANALLEFMLSEENLKNIADYGKKQYGQALFYID